MLEQRCGRSMRNINACSGRLSIAPDATDACNCPVNERNHKRAASIPSDHKGKENY